MAALGCRTTKKINTVISKKDSAQMVLIDPRADSLRRIDNLIMGIEKNRINYETFSAKMKMDYWDKDGKGPDLTVFIRMKKRQPDLGFDQRDRVQLRSIPGADHSRQCKAAE